MRTPQPGDFGLVTKTGSGLMPTITNHLIQFDTESKYCHTFIYRGSGSIVEAVGKVAISPADKYDNIVWSALDLSDAQRAAIVSAAESFVGERYNFLDIVAIAFAQPRFGRCLNENEWWVKRLSDDHMQICSQLVVNAYRLAGIDLFPGILAGLVSPGDLGRVY